MNIPGGKRCEAITNKKRHPFPPFAVAGARRPGHCFFHAPNMAILGTRTWSCKLFSCLLFSQPCSCGRTSSNPLGDRSPLFGSSSDHRGYCGEPRQGDASMRGQARAPKAMEFPVGVIHESPLSPTEHCPSRQILVAACPRTGRSCHHKDPIAVDARTEDRYSTSPYGWETRWDGSANCVVNRVFCLPHGRWILHAHSDRRNTSQDEAPGADRGTLCRCVWMHAASGGSKIAPEPTHHER